MRANVQSVTMAKLRCFIFFKCRRWMPIAIREPFSFVMETGRSENKRHDNRIATDLEKTVLALDVYSRCLCGYFLLTEFYTSNYDSTLGVPSSPVKKHV